jgi:hypothetical protein
MYMYKYRQLSKIVSITSANLQNRHFDCQQISEIVTLIISKFLKYCCHL